MEKSLLVRNALVAFLVIVGVASSRADSSSTKTGGTKNCEDRLNNTRYRCQGNNTLIGEVDKVCLEFKSEGVLSSQFDLDEELDFVNPPAVTTINYGCECGPVGVEDPDFYESRKKFFCASGASSGGLAGTVSKNGRRVVYTGFNQGGASAIYQCTPDPDCTLP